MTETAQALTKIRYIIETTVQGVVEHNTRRYVTGVGGTAQFEYPSLGWFAHFQGSHEAICLVKSEDGKTPEKPDLSMGDKVRITIERIG